VHTRQPSQPRRSNQLTLLIGDDDSAVRECVAELVVGRGFHVLLASSGSESLHLLLSRVVDLTILDVHMPDMTGIEVFERFVRGPFIAASDRAPAPPAERRLDAIFMSADATPDVRTWCERTGKRLLGKPFDPDDMRAAIDAVLSGRAA
jgi:CheY-like chemotaxis protein